MEKPKKTINILLVSDFFFPSIGGVEMHLYELGKALLQFENFRVIVATVQRDDRAGTRYMSAYGLKVYYLPFPIMPVGVSFPTVFCSGPLFRHIFLREKIDIVHAHQATSALALEALVHGQVMGIRTVYSDHSAFSFATIGETHVNKLLAVCTVACHKFITVSHTLRENLTLRTNCDPRKIYVIANAFDSTRFIPNGTKRAPGHTVNIIVVCRMTFRKGVILLLDVIPEICSLRDNVNFIIGGDGPLRIFLESMRDKYQLHDRIQILGHIPPHEVRNVLQQGDIFLNCSLTEGFCIAVIEGASCGLRIVSTCVGGIPEILPSHMMRLCEPDVSSIVNAVLEELNCKKKTNEELWAQHYQVKSMYSWDDIASRVKKVYETVLKEDSYTMAQLIQGLWAQSKLGKIWILVIIFDYIILRLCSYLNPISNLNPPLHYEFKKFPKSKSQ